MFEKTKLAKLKEFMDKPLSKVLAEAGIRVVVLPTAQADFLINQVVPDSLVLETRAGRDLLESLQNQLGDLAK
jgi:hypothetical protein